MWVFSSLSLSRQHEAPARSGVAVALDKNHSAAHSHCQGEESHPHGAPSELWSRWESNQHFWTEAAFG